MQCSCQRVLGKVPILGKPSLSDPELEWILPLTEECDCCCRRFSFSGFFTKPRAPDNQYMVCVCIYIHIERERDKIINLKPALAAGVD